MGVCTGSAPSVRCYQSLLSRYTDEQRKKRYQASVLILTFFAYTSYHLAKRPISIVKGTLNPNCTLNVNGTCNAWSPFDSPKISEELFGLLDCAFLMSYALAMFLSGYIAEHTSLRLYLAGGMVMTGLLTCLFGVAYFGRVHATAYFFLIQILTGITQSTGWPCCVAAVGSWFAEGRRGFVMGVWNLHVSVGNILGSYIAGIFADDLWGLSFIVPGVIIAFFGIVIFLFLVPDPAHVGMEKPEVNQSPVDYSSSINRSSSSDSRSLEQMRANAVSKTVEVNAIGLWGALKIPGVVEYSLCLFFAKLVSYTFLFWLPFYIRSIKVNGKSYSSQEAADWAILFDVGGGIGGICAGFITDLTRCPGIVNVVMLLLAAPALFLFYFHGAESISLFILYMVLAGFLVNGPYSLITTAVSASLGTHSCLKENTKAMAVVSSIIDATGSLGAAIGPLLAGVISSKASWSEVFYMLILADIFAALLLARRFLTEVKDLWTTIGGRLSKRRSLHRLGSDVSLSPEAVNMEVERRPLLSATNT